MDARRLEGKPPYNMMKPYRKESTPVNEYSSLRKQNNAPFTAVVSLALCVVLSATMLFSRLLAFSPADTRHYIPLTESAGLTTVTVSGERLASPRAARPLLSASPFLTADWFRTYDENTVWSGETDIEIFRLSYENGSGQVTVNSENGDKLLAPGTENTYSFALENTGTNSVKYQMSMEAYFTDGTHVIPVEARVSSYEGTWLCGSEGSWEPVLELNAVADSGSLKPGYIMPYTLQWRWPFEIDDEYDTMLGNLAVDEDITLTIVIRTTASYTPDGGSGIPKTGDTSHIGLMLTIMLTSAAGLLLLLLPRRKKEKNDA